VVFVLFCFFPGAPPIFLCVFVGGGVGGGGVEFEAIYNVCVILKRRSQWPRGLRRGSTAARLLRWWVRIPPGTWMSVCCECCVLLGRGLCGELITRPEESYRLWCVVVCDLETSWMRRSWPALGRSATKKKRFWNVCFKSHKIILLAAAFVHV